MTSTAEQPASGSETTLTLPDFLLARVEEDQRWAMANMPSGPRRIGKRVWRHVLTDCEAKRWIVRRASLPVAHAGQDIERTAILKALATRYADHPDWREGWGA